MLKSLSACSMTSLMVFHHTSASGTWLISTNAHPRGGAAIGTPVTETAVEASISRHRGAVTHELHLAPTSGTDGSAH